ncbi:MAG: LPS export ABC transporter ATP-binding protein [Proteobacteria bacterium]|nr:LPS export ABC transporter ATP-binding protein [Pseudomonadota bacterium]NDC25134.1 LPS export ABC transporter ATP-binding protein [Pseudomonadota bacterium]NDD04976.1 LPS export ABC transporter ATP-binding protein [Pseudomonadota bacterium]
MKLEVKNLSKSFNKRKVVNSVSFTLESGRVVGLLGPNGAGKTTTFYMVVGLVKPDSGNVVLNGVELVGEPIFERARQGLGYLPQEATVFRKLSVEENLYIVLENLKISRKEKRERAEKALSELGISRLAKNKALNLSGGERRRLEIARALILEPKFLLLDEPYAGIDPLAVIEIQGIIKGLRERGIGVIITDHNVRETLTSCDEAYLIKDGQIWVHGSPEEIVANESARKFYLGENFKL